MTNQDWYGDLAVGRVMTQEPIIKSGDHMEYAVYGLQENGTISIGNTPTPGKYLVLPRGVRAKDVQRAWYVFLKTICPDRTLHSPDGPSLEEGDDLCITREQVKKADK